MFSTEDVERGVRAGAVGGGPTLNVELGVATLNSEGLYWVGHHGHHVICVPSGDDALKKRPLVCAHLKGTGPRGVNVTIPLLERQILWERGKTLPHFTVGNYVSVA